MCLFVCLSAFYRPHDICPLCGAASESESRSRRGRPRASGQACTARARAHAVQLLNEKIISHFKQNYWQEETSYLIFGRSRPWSASIYIYINEELRCKTRYMPNLKNRDFSIIRNRDVSRIQWSRSFLSKRALAH